MCYAISELLDLLIVLPAMKVLFYYGVSVNKKSRWKGLIMVDK
jgi:hypothetical protein